MLGYFYFLISAKEKADVDNLEKDIKSIVNKTQFDAQLSKEKVIFANHVTFV